MRNEKSPGMPYRPPHKRAVGMIYIRMITIVTPAPIYIGRSAVSGNIVPAHHRVAVIDHINIAASVYIDVDVLLAIVNIHLIANIRFISDIIIAPVIDIVVIDCTVVVAQFPPILRL